MMKNIGPSRFSATKPAGTISKEDLIIGTHPWLFNKDRVRSLYTLHSCHLTIILKTRYGGLTVIPEHLLAVCS